MLARREHVVPKFVAGGICAALLFCGSTAFAQDEEEEEEENGKTEEVKPTTTAPVTPAATTAPVRPVTGTDHNAMVGKFGISWFGVSSIPIGTGTPVGTGDDPEIAPGAPASVSTPAIGIRYWLNDRIGIDAGAGISIAAGDARNVTSGVDKQTIFSMLAHAGMPFSVASGKHISLQLIPEMNLGFAVSSVEPVQGPNPPPNATLTGVRFDVGARIGGEVHFGFMDIPELSLEGSVGLFLTYQATKAEVATAFASQYNILVTTAAYQNPWDIFTSYVRARYYF
jgi:hypothetical protein